VGKCDNIKHQITTKPRNKHQQHHRKVSNTITCISIISTQNSANTRSSVRTEIQSSNFGLQQQKQTPNSDAIKVGSDLFCRCLLSA